MREYADLTTAYMLSMDETNEPERKSVFFAAVKSFSASIGAVMLAQTFFNNMGVRDVLKSKFNLSVIGLGTALGVIKASQHNQEIAPYAKRLEQETTGTNEHEQGRG